MVTTSNVHFGISNQFSQNFPIKMQFFKGCNFLIKALSVPFYIANEFLLQNNNWERASVTVTV